jgi:alkylhydroperoxidase family enzyme
MAQRLQKEATCTLYCMEMARKAARDANAAHQIFQQIFNYYNN